VQHPALTDVGPTHYLWINGQGHGKVNDVARADAFGPHVTVFHRLGQTAAERAWLAELPGLVASLEQRWRIRTDMPFHGGTSSWVAPGVTDDGRDVVLKVAWPHREARAEAAGLRLWDGNGAPLLFAADEARYALLMERCIPGRPLGESRMVPEDALICAGRVLRELWVSADGDRAFETVADVCAEWAALVRERVERYRPPYDASLVRFGADLLESLPATAQQRVVVHGDANPTNFLSARRLPWLWIDAKPMVGDPAYDAPPLLVQVSTLTAVPDASAELGRRCELLADVMGQPVERLAAWGVARAVESALWHTSEDDRADGEADMAIAAAFAAFL
jgi:streptomycin 6-kinase